jgi:hypothetical protein
MLRGRAHLQALPKVMELEPEEYRFEGVAHEEEVDEHAPPLALVDDVALAEADLSETNYSLGAEHGH